ncbi:QueT transporter family protein [Clostridium sp. D53t1_180928_C8]|uniref:QueT transporter family protein n=1 Tax=Clostridium sp. D53t1_180928_C8 TaxID=2787101 RepID=UPI0018AA9B09|nr:QueT transporter family protein [Clostridium sp. D53t1_180928_C8]
MKNDLTKRLTRTAIIAAIYAVVTVAIAPLSYMGVQFRISEVLVLLAVFDPLYIGGLTLGCLIANLLGPNGPLDVILGTLATFISVYAIYLTGKIVKNYKAKLLIASIWPTIFNGLIIGWMLNMLYGLPLVLSMGQVALGELVVITCIGVPLFLLAGSRLKNAMTFK